MNNIICNKAEGTELLTSPKNALKISASFTERKKKKIASVTEVYVFGGKGPEENYIFVVKLGVMMSMHMYNMWLQIHNTQALQTKKCRFSKINP